MPPPRLRRARRDREVADQHRQVRAVGAHLEHTGSARTRAHAASPPAATRPRARRRRARGRCRCSRAARAPLSRSSSSTQPTARQRRSSRGSRSTKRRELVATSEHPPVAHVDRILEVRDPEHQAAAVERAGQESRRLAEPRACGRGLGAEHVAQQAQQVRAPARRRHEVLDALARAAPARRGRCCGSPRTPAPRTARPPARASRCRRCRSASSATTSTTSITVSSRSSTKRLTYGAPSRAVTFQSMSRTSSPGTYGRTSSNSTPRPLKTLCDRPANRSSTRWRLRISRPADLAQQVRGLHQGTRTCSRMRRATSSPSTPSASASYETWMRWRNTSSAIALTSSGSDVGAGRRAAPAPGRRAPGTASRAGDAP